MQTEPAKSIAPLPSAPRLPAPRPTPVRHNALWLALIVALVHGLLYVVMVPPWQHYDEPSHFEYAWLIAHQRQLPKPDGGDLTLRRELIRSMGQHGFYDDLGGAPNADALTPDQLNIGISQLDGPPGYYLWAAAWMWPVRTQSLETQLIAVRLSSLALLLIVIGLGYVTTLVLTRAGSPLRWMVPLAMAMLPSFVDLMSAANDDAGAVLVASLLIFSMVLLVARGWSWRRLLLIGLALGVCLGVKRTVLPLLIGVPLALILSMLHGRRRWAVWVALIVGTLGMLPVLFAWGDPAGWIRGSFQTSSLRGNVEGKPVLQLTASTQQPHSAALQLFPREDALPGSDVTVGVWMWASRPITAQLPAIFVEELIPISPPKPVALGTQPKFFAYNAAIPANVERVYLIARPEPVFQDEAPVEVYLQQIVVAKGAFGINTIPEFNGVGWVGGRWGGSSFINLVRNADLTTTWPYLRPRWIASTPLARTFEFGTFNLLAGVIDRAGAGWYFRITLDNMVRSFWAVFGWGHVRMTPKWYMVLYGVVGLGLLGSLVSIIRRLRARQQQMWSVLAVLALMTVLLWSMTALRGIHSLIFSIFIPGARYAYVVIVPTMLFLCAGLLEWAYLTRPALIRLRVSWRVLMPTLWLAGWLVLDVAAILRVIGFYADR